MKKHLCKAILLVVSVMMVSSLSAQDDRATFGLKGNVTSVTPNYENQTFAIDNRALSFSETGKLLKINGETDMFERDKKGRITKLFFDDGCSISYDTLMYDNKGRITQVRSFVYVETGYDSETGETVGGMDVEGGNAKYYYDADGKVSKIVVYNAYDSTTNTVNFFYRKVDDSGNWVERVVNCPNLGLNNQVEKRTLSYTEEADAAATSDATMDATQMGSDEGLAPKQSKKISFWDAFFGFLLLAALLFMIVYMVYILLIRDRKLLPKTVEDFKAYRRELGLPAESSDVENESISPLFEDVYHNLTQVRTGGEVEQYFTTKEQIEGLRSALVQTLETAPTQPACVDLYNEMLADYKASTKRQFMGSKPYLIVGGVITVLMTIGGGLMALPFMLLNICGYYFASQETQFMINAKELKEAGSTGKSKLMTILLTMGVGVLFSGQTYKTVTKWSDGTTSTDYDNSEHLVAFILGMIIIVVLAFFMFVVALVNFIRNYLIYR